MILLDTHVWVWLVHGDATLPAGMMAAIQLRQNEGIAVSAISCWEVAKLVERGRLELPMDTHEWMALALDASGVSVVPLTPAVAIESTSLPGEFHRDPADQIIVASSRVHGFPLLTLDEKIRAYPYVGLLEDARVHDR